MLDFGFSEILLTSAIALVVLGPEKLPKVARQVGNWMGRARLMARQLSEQLEREVNAEELLKQQTRISPPARAPAATLPPPPRLHPMRPPRHSRSKPRRLPRPKRRLCPVRRRSHPRPSWPSRAARRIRIHRK